jgi:c(7)-type cytochrome triheme protein
MQSLARNSPRRRARLFLLLLLVAVAAWFGVERPLAASTTQEKPAGAKPEDEKDGGEIVFPVIGNRLQKYSVLYSHEVHLATGLKCDVCHETIFKKKLNANEFKMADVNKGLFCGACHTDKPAAELAAHKAFAPKGNCTKCHTLRLRDK